MNKCQTIIIMMVTSLLLSSCGGNGKSEIENTFNEWAQHNMPSRYKINSITYDTVGSLTDIIYNDYILIDSKGGNTKALELFNKGVIQYVDDCKADTSLPTSIIVVAKVRVSMPDGDKDYYMGMYKDSVATQPYTSGMKALGDMPQESLCLFIETFCDVFKSLSEIMPETQFNVDEFAYETLTDPDKPKAPAGFNNAIIEGVSSAINNTRSTF